MRLVDHQGGGREALYRLSFSDGVPPPDFDPLPCIAASGPGTVQVARRAPATTFLALLIDPGATAEESQRATRVATALLARRPAGDRVAVFRWADRLTQVATFTGDRTFLSDRLRAGLTPSAAPRVAIGAALAQVGAVARSADGPARAALRAIVVISPRALVESGPAVEALTLWLAPGAVAALADVPAGLRFDLDAADADAQVSARLDAYRERAHVGVGLCTGAQGGDLTLTAAGAPNAVYLPAAAPEFAAGACDAAAIAAGTRAFPRRIELVFTSQQKSVAEQRFAAASTDDFDLSVRLHPEQAPIPAVAHYRGSSSFENPNSRCARPNYDVNLEGKRARFPMPGAAHDKFLLISMCLDRLYLRAFSLYQLLRDEELFAGNTELVELVVDGKSQGVYLITEDVTDRILQAYSGVNTVIRRDTIPIGRREYEYEMKFSIHTKEVALANFAAILSGATGKQGAALEDALRARLDLDQYLRWLALMSLFQMGDYLDEAYFYAVETTGADGAKGEIHRMVAWDPDDIFQPCHNGGVNEWKDPRGIAYCAEDPLDKLLLADARGYGLFVDALAAIIARTPKERFQGALMTTRDKLAAYFQDPALLAAQVELKNLIVGGVTSESATAALDKDVADLVARYDEVRAGLLAKIAAYRGAH